MYPNYLISSFLVDFNIITNITFVVPIQQIVISLLKFYRYEKYCE
jgi:hypothetical protein